MASQTGHSMIVNNVIRNISRSTQGSCSTQQGIYISDVDSYIANNLISSVSVVGIHQWHGASRSTIVNNTVMDCLWGILVGSGDSGMLPNGSQDNYVANNILASNATAGIYEYGLTSRNTYRNNILFNNPKNVINASGDSISGTITLDPQFVNFKRDGTGDYHLQSTSPAIDKGLAQSAPSTDLDGHRRPSGLAVDIGAYEFMSSTTPAPSPAPSPGVSISVSSSQLAPGQAFTVTVNGANASDTDDYVALYLAIAPDSAYSYKGQYKALAGQPLQFIAPMEAGTYNMRYFGASNAQNRLAVSANLVVAVAAPAPAVSLSTTSLFFGDVAVGSTSAVQTVTIKNTGTKAFSIPSGFVISGDFAFGNLGTCSVGASYAPGAGCTARVVFKPKMVGARTGSLSILTSASSTPLVVRLSGNGK